MALRILKNIESDAGYGHKRETNTILHDKNLLDLAEQNLMNHFDN